jgi:predicted dehydrogenase
MNRREFLSTAAAAGLGAPLLVGQTKPLVGRSANDKIQLALIGCGGMGQGDARTSTGTGLTRIVAASDCYDGRMERMRELYGKDVYTSRDYRDILARKDVDAVIIGTPDHWHSRISIDAMQAKKDVYCEKPMVQHVDDGWPVIDAQRQTGRIMQVGSQRVSSIVYKKAQEVFRSGALGKLNMVEAWWDRDSAVGAWQYAIPADAGTETCDWNQFQGRAPKTEWDEKRFFRWRCYRDYGTGVAGDLFVHLFSGLHFITSAIGPTRVFATGGLHYWKDGRDVPDLFYGIYDYPETATHPAFNLVLRVNFAAGAKESQGFRFIGSDAIMTVDPNVTVTAAAPETQPGYTINTFDKAEQTKFLTAYHAKYPEVKISPASMKNSHVQVYDPPPGYSDHHDHHVNFAMSVRSRKPVVEDPTFGFRAAGPAVLSNISYFENRIVEWDPAAMKVKA